jgi:hypothetical protein
MLTAEDRARVAITIGADVQRRLVLDVLTRTNDPIERNELLAGAIGILLRHLLQSIALKTDREAWLSEIIKVAVA